MFYYFIIFVDLYGLLSSNLSYLKVREFTTLLEPWIFTILFIDFFVLNVIGFLLFDVNKYPYYCFIYIFQDSNHLKSTK
jgi:hypothetical protein